MDTVQDARRLLLRGKQNARDQWRFHCAIHNLLKLHRAGGLDLITKPDTAPASTPTAKRRPPDTREPHALDRGNIRRSLADRFTWNAPISVTDPGS
jgi:hypothetical protein